MSRLIDADALSGILREQIAFRTKNLDTSYDYQTALSFVENMPTIEPERKKGKWLLSDGYRCSVCSYKVLSTGLPSKCPNCYAEMER